MSGPKSGKPIDPALAVRYVESPAWTSKVAPTADGCRLWTGARNGNGYGFCTIARGVYKVHRVAWVAANDRDIPAGMVIDHLCRQRGCVNPAHLRVVTVRDNIVAFGSENMIAAQVQQTHCKRGHALTGDNLAPYALGRGRRACRACKAEGSAA